MRADMSKKLVERPRGGWQTRNNTVLRGRQAVDLESLPRRSRMRPDHGSRKHLSENFAPLLRFLRTRCGTPWDRVESELRQGLDLRSATQIHIFEHLYDFVAVHAEVQDGVVFDVGRTWGGRQELRRNGRSFYVDPKSGLLEEVPARRAQPPSCSADHLERDGQIYARLRGVWYRVQIGARPWYSRHTVCYATRSWDVLLKQTVVHRNEAQRLALYGEPERFATAKQPLNRKALKALGLWRR